MAGIQRWAWALLFLAECGPKPPVRTALRGDLAMLKRDIAAAQQARELTPTVALHLAQAVAEREVMSAEGKYGARRVRTLRACARPLRDVMEKRATDEDDVSAELSLILLEQNVLDRISQVNRYAGSDSGGFRAVAARAAVRPIDGDVRQHFFADPDERVRRAAFSAAYDARQPSELGPLLDSARLDPDPQAQNQATRAAGAIGGEHAVLALKDLWARADEARKIGIVDAWAEKASFVAGGERELSVVADSGGVAGVSASYALVRAGGAGAAPANAQLRHAIREGTDDEKRLALNVIELSLQNEAAVLEASRTASAELQVVALSRLSDLPGRSDRALSALRVLANQTVTSEAELRAREAAVDALARAGDSSVEPALVKALRSGDMPTRWHAARALTSLGDYSDAATALADDDARVRTDVACALLSRRGRSAH